MINDNNWLSNICQKRDWGKCLDAWQGITADEVKSSNWADILEPVCTRVLVLRYNPACSLSTSLSALALWMSAFHSGLIDCDFLVIVHWQCSFSK